MFESKSSNKIYLLHFNKNEVSKSDIYKIKVVYKHVVQWRPYRQRNGQLTQCYNCGMHGHGAANCHRKKVCFLCSKDHTTKEFNGTKNSDCPPVFKCINCLNNNLPHNHKANDVNCPSRNMYIEIRNRKHSNSKKTVLVDAPRPPPLTRTFAATVTADNDTTKTNPNLNFAFINTNTNTNNGDANSLWSFAEVCNIMMSCLNDLSKCQNKTDQLKVIVNVMQNAFK